jgi:hypothetical protein
VLKGGWQSVSTTPERKASIKVCPNRDPLISLISSAPSVTAFSISPVACAYSMACFSVIARPSAQASAKRNVNRPGRQAGHELPAIAHLGAMFEEEPFPSSGWFSAANAYSMACSSDIADPRPLAHCTRRRRRLCVRATQNGNPYAGGAVS